MSSAAATLAASSLPGECPHCGSAGDYSSLQGLHFCNLCGKKVHPPGAPSPPFSAMSPTPSPPAASPSRGTVAAGDSSLYSTPRGTLSAAIGAAELDDEDDVSAVPAEGVEEDDEVQFKHQSQSPPPAGQRRAPNAIRGPDFHTAPTPAPPKRHQPAFAAPTQSAPAGSPVAAAPAASPTSSGLTQAQVIAAARQALATPTSPSRSPPASASPTTVPAHSPPLAASRSAPTATTSTAAASARQSGPVVKALVPTIHTASPSATAVVATPAAAAGAVVTLTEEEFAGLEASIRGEVLAAQAAESEILAMEFETLEKTNARLQGEKEELARTMDDMMDSYAKLVEEANARKNDYTAQMGILETEMALLRTQHATQKNELTALRASHARLQSEHEEAITLSSEQVEALEQARADNEALRAQYEKLHSQAQNKLAASGDEYRKVLQRAADREATVQALQDELEQERARAAQAEELAAQLQAAAALSAQRAAQLEASSEAARSESVDMRAQVRTLSQQVADTKVRMDEAQHISQRYKEQILEHREKLREMDEARAAAASMEREQARMASELSVLSKDNQQLKSQLFDAMQMEKALKAQMAAGGMSAAALADAGHTARMEAELASLHAALDQKDNEHKELMAICTDLISQVETLKAQQTSY